MLATIAIYGLGVTLCVLAALGLSGLLYPTGRWVGFGTLPLGLCALITLLYPLGAVMPGTAAASATLAIVLVALAGALLLRKWLRRRAGRTGLSLGEAVVPTRQEALVIAAGALAGLLLLAPVMELGFPTTIAVTNNDGWGYASLVDWLKTHPFPRDVVPDIAQPLTFVPWNTGGNGFGFGFERFAAMLATLLSREGFEVVNAAAAVALGAAVGGWAQLAASLRLRVASLEAVVVTVVAASPLLVLPFAENYTTQFVSLCLWPFALAAFARVAGSPDWRGVVIAAVAVGTVVGVYPSVAPWLVLPLVVVALMAPGRPNWAGTRLQGIGGPGVPARAGRAIALLVVVGAASLLVAPIQMFRALDNLQALNQTQVVIGGFFASDAYAAFFLGVMSALSLFPRGPLGWSALALLILLAAAYAIALAPWRRLGTARPAIAALAGCVLFTAAAIIVQYGLRDERPYHVYKGLMSGGAILSGLVVIGLLWGRGDRLRTLQVAALGCCAAVWISTSAQVLDASSTAGAGFRAADVEMGRELESLPAGSVVLAEGAAPDERSFQFRMMTAYFGAKMTDGHAIGLGTTGSYITGGGLPEWRPAEPWTQVLTTRAQPIATPRALLWSNAVYTLSTAPPQDVTIYGTAWYPPEQEDGNTFAWTSGPVEVVVSNRGAARTVRLRMTVGSYAAPRTLIVTAGGVEQRERLPAWDLVAVDVLLRLPARSTTPVTLDGTPRARAGPPGDPRQLMIRVQGLRIVGAPGG